MFNGVVKSNRFDKVQYYPKGDMLKASILDCIEQTKESRDDGYSVRCVVVSMVS